MDGYFVIDCRTGTRLNAGISSILRLRLNGRASGHVRHGVVVDHQRIETNPPPVRQARVPRAVQNITGSSAAHPVHLSRAHRRSYDVNRGTDYHIFLQLADADYRLGWTLQAHGGGGAVSRGDLVRSLVVRDAGWGRVPILATIWEKYILHVVHFAVISIVSFVMIRVI